MIDLQNGSVVHSWQYGPGTRRLNQIAFAPDGRHIITANGDGTIYVFRLREWYDGGAADVTPKKPKSK